MLLSDIRLYTDLVSLKVGDNVLDKWQENDWQYANDLLVNMWRWLHIGPVLVRVGPAFDQHKICTKPRNELQSKKQNQEIQGAESGYKTSID